jgi:hypothetical protein
VPMAVGAANRENHGVIAPLKLVRYVVPTNPTLIVVLGVLVMSLAYSLIALWRGPTRL